MNMVVQIRLNCKNRKNYVIYTYIILYKIFIYWNHGSQQISLLREDVNFKKNHNLLLMYIYYETMFWVLFKIRFSFESIYAYLEIFFWFGWLRDNDSRLNLILQALMNIFMRINKFYIYSILFFFHFFFLNKQNPF